MGLVQAILEEASKDSKPVAHGGQKANLVRLRAIVSRNLDFSYPEFLFLELDQNLRVEMEVIRAAFEGDLLQGFARIGPESGVVFGELHSQRPVFDSGEELVPEKLVQRHTALQRMTGHAGAEDQVGLIFQDRLNEIRNVFGRVLNVSMK